MNKPIINNTLGRLKLSLVLLSTDMLFTIESVCSTILNTANFSCKDNLAVALLSLNRKLV